MKILLVEDTEQLNKALTTVLRRNSYVVDSAFDGEEALLFIDQFQYDLIILDIMLPKVNGLEVLKQSSILKILSRSVVPRTIESSMITSLSL